MLRRTPSWALFRTNYCADSSENVPSPPRLSPRWENLEMRRALETNILLYFYILQILSTTRIKIELQKNRFFVYFFGSIKLKEQETIKQKEKMDCYIYFSSLINTYKTCTV